MLWRRLLVFGGPGMLLFTAAGIAAPDRAADKKSSPGAQVIRLLDGFVQRRFEEDNGKLGISRLVPPISGHDTVWYDLQAKDSGEKEVLRAVQESGYEYLVEFVHCTHVPGRVKNPPEALPDKAQVRGITLIAANSTVAPFRPYSFGKDRLEFTKSTEEPIKEKASSVVDRIAKGRSVDTTVSGWQVGFRPVRASKASCLSCHSGAKSGDMLGVMAYAVRQPIKAESTNAVTK